MRRTYKYRLFTNANQERELDIMLETHRRLYNAALDGTRLCWETAGVKWSCYEQGAWFTVQRKLNPYYARINAWSGKETLRKLDRAYGGFIRGKRLPRYKSKGQFNTFAFTMEGRANGCRFVGGKLNIQYVGDVRVRWHRPLPENGKLKLATILKSGRKWYVLFCVEFPDEPREHGGGSIGVDLGIKAFATTSDGESLGDSKLLHKAKGELSKLKRAHKRCQCGSRGQARIRERIGRLHAKVRNARRDMHHKVARYLVDRYAVIAVEDLDIKGMLTNHWMTRHILDAGWGLFVLILTSKAESAGSRVIKVNPSYTSQDCSGCGNRVKKSLSVRVHRCDCGLVIDRDVNAAKNILARAAPRGDNTESSVLPQSHNVE